MADVDKLINGILADPRLQKSRAFSDKVYDDEPIIRRASQMSTYLPQRYRDMRALGQAESRSGSGPQAAGLPGADRWGRPGAPVFGRRVRDPLEYRRPTQTKLFVDQARFMEDWEDDCPYHGTFSRYYPTYAMMSDQQLRGYFTWRAQVRRGVVEATSLSFAFVYIYELLNGIGGSDPRACFDKLFAFWQAYRAVAPEIDRYAKSWLRDFIVYHGLPAALMEQVVDTSFEQALIVARRAEAALIAEPGEACASSLAAADAQSALCQALAALSSYRIDRSAFAAAHEADVSAVVVQVFAGLVRHCARRRKRGFIDSLFGLPYASPHIMFEAAVFYEPARHPDCLYQVNEAHSYSCKDGRWMALRQYREPGRNAELGAILHGIDRAMRLAWGDDHPLKERELPKYVMRMIDEAVAARRAQVRDQEARRVTIDRSQLAGIRARAADIREQLLVDEERDGAAAGEDAPAVPSEGAPVPGALAPAASVEPAAPSPQSTASSSAAMAHVPATPAPAATAVNTAPAPAAAAAPALFSPEETAYVRALLSGTGVAAAVAASGRSEDMLVDAVNEALFDLIGDTALEYGEAGPQVIDDYREEVEGAVAR